MTYFTCFFLDNEKDIIVSLYKDLDRLYYVLTTPNHSSGNLIRNLSKVCRLPLSKDDDNKLIIKGEVPCFIDGCNEEQYIFKMGETEIASISAQGDIEMKATIPAIAKTLMSQTKEFHLEKWKTFFKTYIRKDL